MTDCTLHGGGNVGTDLFRRGVRAIRSRRGRAFAQFDGAADRSEFEATDWVNQVRGVEGELRELHQAIAELDNETTQRLWLEIAGKLKGLPKAADAIYWFSRAA